MIDDSAVYGFLDEYKLRCGITEHGLKHYENQIMRKILEPMNAKFGTDISDAAIRAAVAEHNEVCRILTEIGNMRKLKNPPVTGYEYHVHWLDC